MSKRILVAGIGNIFLGDDAFGVETVRKLIQSALPDAVQVIDFGIRSYDLAYAMADGYEAIILVDATARGYAPGTVYLIEPDLTKLDQLDAGAVDAHSMNPVRVLQMAQSLGGQPGRLFLVGCEPAVLEREGGEFGLSDQVQAGVPKAVEMIESLIGDLLQENINQKEPALVKPDTGEKIYA